jgi:GNAT superfamily N-acetyltransferase
MIRDINVRPAFDDERDEIFALDAKCFDAGDVKLDKSDAVDWFVAVATFDLDNCRRQDVVAYGGVRPSRRYTDVWYHVRAGVAPGFRGMGLQQRLIRIRERWAKRNGATYCVTDTHPDNVGSMRNLLRCGYLPYLPEHKWAGDSIYLSRKL